LIFGLDAEQWAIMASIATFAYSGVLLVLALPRLGRLVRHYWRWIVRGFNDEASNDDNAGA